MFWPERLRASLQIAGAEAYTSQSGRQSASTSALRELRVRSDSDWAGGSRAQKSPSGFIVQLCRATVSFGPRAQESIATSSLEAELRGGAAATAE
eukprot:8911925-Alexandrium_andersonii.AAC.1